MSTQVRSSGNFKQAQQEGKLNYMSIERAYKSNLRRKQERKKVVSSESLRILQPGTIRETKKESTMLDGAEALYAPRDIQKEKGQPAQVATKPKCK